MTKAVELRNQMSVIWDRMKAIHDVADAENRDLSAEEQDNWKAAQDDFFATKARFERAEYLESVPLDDVEQDKWQIRHDKGAGEPKTTQESEARGKLAYKMAFLDYMSARSVKLIEAETWDVLYNGPQRAPLSAEDQARLKNMLSPDQYKAAMSVGSQTGGGLWVPDEMMERIEKALLWYGGMRQYAETITTPDGGDLPWPVYDDTSNQGRRLAENTTATQTDIAVGLRVLKAYMYTSDELLISLQLMQDRPDLASGIVADALGERIARCTNNEFTNYNGGDGPQGLIVNLATGVTAAATGSVTADELRNLKYSVNRAYRDRPKAAYMMHDQTLRDVMGLKDGEGDYLFESPTSGTEPVIWGQPVIVNNDMPTMATGVTSIVYGDGGSYKIREVSGFTLLRMDERYAPVLQVSFLGFARYDGGYINAGQNPIKALVQA